MIESINLNDIQPGMRLKSTFTNEDSMPPIKVLRLIENGFTYKFDEDVHYGLRYGYISKDSENEAYAVDGMVFYKLYKDPEKFTLTVIEYKKMEETMLASALLYGTPTHIAFDKSGRAYVWPIPFRLKRE